MIVIGSAIPFHEKEYAKMTPASSNHLDSAATRSDAETSVDSGLTQQTVRRLAHQAGFTEAGMVGLPHADSDRDAAGFDEFIDAGRAGSMAYLARRNEAGELIRGSIRRPFPWARSVVVCMASYHADAPQSIAPAAEDAGWIARYAWSGRLDKSDRGDGKGTVRPSDYHKVLLKRLRALEGALHEAFGAFESRAYVDTGPVVERNAARAAGLGWTGKNTCLIHPKLGSWNFLAVIVTSLELPAEQAPLTIPDRCGSCRRCLDACPTDALIEPYRMDATRCISYLTIEDRGDAPDELRAAMGRQVFGCDICQDVCPWNRKAPIGTAPDLMPRAELINPSLEWLADLELADFERLFNGSPVRRAGFAGLRRNIAIAMGNSRLRRFLPRLEGWAEETAGDSDSTPLQSAARWAMRRIGQAHNLGDSSQ
jgi:epoxyqueuosine reductase